MKSNKIVQENLKEQTKKGLYWKFAEQLSNYGIQFIIGIFMARMLSPNDFGITALPAVFLSVAGIFVNGGFFSALVRKPEISEYDLSTAFYYSLGLGVIMYVALFCASPLIADFYNTPVLTDLIRITALSFLYSPLGTPQGVLLARRLDFKTPAKLSVVCRIITGIIGIFMAFIGYGLWSLVISGMVSGIAYVIIIWFVVRWMPKTGWSKESFKYLWNYGNKLMGSYLISTIYENIAPIIIGKYYSPAQLGIYNRAEGYAKMPSQNITGTLQSVTFPVLSKMQDDNEKLARNYRKILRVSAFIIFPVMMILAALARPLIITMITEKWESCIILLQLLCFSMMWYPIHAINLNLLQVKGRSDLFLRLEIIKRAIGLGILLFTLPFGLIYFCIGNVVSSLLCLFVNTYYTGKIINVGYFKQMKDLLPILILSLCVFAIVQFSNYFIQNYLLQILIGGILSCVLYLGVAWIVKFPELNDVKYLIANKK